MQELRIKSLSEEINSLRSALVEREDIISKLRVEVHKQTTRIIDFKVCYGLIQFCNLC